MNSVVGGAGWLAAAMAGVATWRLGARCLVLEEKVKQGEKFTDSARKLFAVMSKEGDKLFRASLTYRRFIEDELGTVPPVDFDSDPLEFLRKMGVTSEGGGWPASLSGAALGVRQ